MVLILIYYLILILYGTIVIMIPAIGFIDSLRKKKTGLNETNKISIIIPFRNEAETIRKLCKSINQLKYPKDLFEVIFIDDDSADQSLSILNELNPEVDFELIQNPSHLGKKASIIAGVESAKYNLILTTDADCILPGTLLNNINKSDDLSVGVALKTTSKWGVIENIQEVESLLLGGITIGSTLIEIPMLASGANLAYKKDLLINNQPYKDNMDINSGDDMFLLKSALVHNVKIGVRSKNPVITQCEPTWNAYINQSARWAGKNDRVGLTQTTLAAWAVLSANLLLPLSLITHFSSGLIILSIKFVLDFLFLFLSAVHYERFKAILFAPLVFCFYPIHLVRVAAKIIKKKREA